VSVRRVFVTYRGADAAHFAERLHSDLATHLGHSAVVVHGGPRPGDIVLVVLADRGLQPRSNRLEELRADAIDEAILRGEDVITVRISNGSRTHGWFVKEAEWDADVGRIAARLKRMLERGLVPPRALGAASDPDLLERLLGAEAGGTITRTRAGRTAQVSRRRPPEPVAPAEPSTYAPAPELEPEPEPDHDEPLARHLGSPRSSRLLLIAFALAGAGGIAAAIIRWLIGGVVIPPTDAGTTDDIDVTVFSPVHAAPGDALLVQVFAHLPAQAHDARALATEFDEDTNAGGFTSLSLPVSPGAELGFELRAPGLEVDEGGQRLVWRRRAQSVQFGVTVPDSARPGTRIATLIVSRDSVPVGHVKFKLTVEPRLASRAGLAPAGENARAYERTFASYAREDIREVLRRVQVLRHKRLTRLRLFQDILDIDPGERWSQRLYTEIDNCDVVLLFWSTAAHDSEWVRREVQYALARHVTEYDPPEIIPVIIEVPPCTPWPELAHQHFDDQIARLIAEL
jgi:hypothetical protein